MCELEDRIEFLESELQQQCDNVKHLRYALAASKHGAAMLRDELDFADELHYDTEAASGKANFWLAGAVVLLVMWIFTA